MARTYEYVILLHKNTKKVGFWTHGNYLYKNICHYKLSPSNLDSKLTPIDLVSVFGIGAKIRTPPVSRPLFGLSNRGVHMDPKWLRDQLRSKQ